MIIDTSKLTPEYRERFWARTKVIGDCIEWQGRLHRGQRVRRRFSGC